MGNYSDEIQFCNDNDSILSLADNTGPNAPVITLELELSQKAVLNNNCMPLETGNNQTGE